MSSKDLTAFLAWAEENEILWDKSAIEIKEGKYGFGLYAKRHLDPGYEVVKVPKAIVLSVETTGIANLLEDDEIEGYVGLILGCMYEMSRGSESPWSTYLSFLGKRPAQMATSLSKDAREMMKYCEAYNDIESDIKDLQEDYESIVVPFIEKYPEVFPREIRNKFFSLDAFKATAGQVSSHTMDVDHFHISALVPFADFPAPNAEFLTHEDVCEICGALVCEHREGDDDSEDGSTDSDDNDEVPELSSGDNNNVDDKVPDLVIGHGIMASPKRKIDEDEGEEWDDEEDEDDDDEQEINDTCDIILDTDVRKGQEITRNYGPYPNKILLSKYGFAVENNPHDTVTIQLEMIRQAAQKFIKDDGLVEERIQWFLENEDAFVGAECGDHQHGDGCCSGGGEHGHDHTHQNGSDANGTLEEHKHSKDGRCCGDKNSKEQKKKGRSQGSEEDQSDEEIEEDNGGGNEDDSEDDGEDNDEFPRDIMYMMHDGSVDDRLLMLLNVLFMEKGMFENAKDNVDGATDYFNEIFLRRQQEEHGDSEDEEMDEDTNEDEEEGSKKPKVELKPRDAKSKKVRKAVLKAILALIRIRADAFGVTDKTTAAQDLAKLKKAKLSSALYYGGLCVQGEKQILQNALQAHNHLLSEL
ncbi:hypothetical protein BGZ65_000434 [Modicella reniformis]|uniref:SET domain-containing protein n=1 Tax=Modicella reniformis TaxID=1440133 RepID=A0A9P6SQN9_9FUNG|nr:hypothetical protein BGZ65_000434 [Modicella reniformis]